MNNKGESKYIFTTEGHFFPIKQQFISKRNKNKNNLDISHNKCELNINKNYFKMRYNLPMKIKYFEQLFEMIGVNDNLENLLQRNFKK